MASWTVLQTPGSFRTEHRRQPHAELLRPQQQLKVARCTHQSKRRRTVTAQAAAAGAGSSSEDPYKVTIALKHPEQGDNAQTAESPTLKQVLGLSPGAPSDALDRAYKRKRSENKFNEKELERIESAHSTLMMSALSARLQVYHQPRRGFCMMLCHTSFAACQAPQADDGLFVVRVAAAVCQRRSSLQIDPHSFPGAQG